MNFGLHATWSKDLAVTSQGGVLLEKLITAYLVNKFLNVYGSRKFSTLFIIIRLSILAL
jgi:hypothetical protein